MLPFGDAHHGTRAQLAVRGRLRVQPGVHEGQTLTADVEADAPPARDRHRLRRDLEHHRRQQLAHIAGLGHGFLDALLAFQLIGCLQVHHRLRPAIALLAVIGEHGALNRCIGGLLVLGADRGVDLQAARVGVLLELIGHQRPRHFGGPLRLQREGGAVGVQLQLFIQRRLVFRLGDEAQRAHPGQYIALALLGPLGVGNGIVTRRGLGQPGQHGHLADGQLGQRLAEIRLGRRGKAVRALAQEDLVGVDLEDLRLGELLLDAQREQHLVELAHEAAFAAQERGAGQLHGDGAGPLAAPARLHVGQDGTRHPEQVDAVVGEEIIVLGRQDGLAHLLGKAAVRHDRALFRTVLADQQPVGREDLHRQLGLVVGERGERWQPAGGHLVGHDAHQRPRHHQRATQRHGPAQKAQHRVTAWGLRASTAGLARSGAVAGGSAGRRSGRGGGWLHREGAGVGAGKRLAGMQAGHSSEMRCDERPVKALSGGGEEDCRSSSREIPNPTL